MAIPPFLLLLFSFFFLNLSQTSTASVLLSSQEGEKGGRSAFIVIGPQLPVETTAGPTSNQSSVFDNGVTLFGPSETQFWVKTVEVVSSLRRARMANRASRHLRMFGLASREFQSTREIF
jgi:hypothetical protein